MAVKPFNYSAMDAQGKERKGIIFAGNETDANTLIKNKGLFPTSITNGKNVKQEKVEEKENQTEEVERKIIFRIRIFGFVFTLERI